MAEPDWDTLAVDHPDSDLSRACTQHVTDKVIAVPAVIPITPVFRGAHAADKILGLGCTTERATVVGASRRSRCASS